MTTVLSYCDTCKQTTEHKLWEGYCSCNKCKGAPKKSVGILK